MLRRWVRQGTPAYYYYYYCYCYCYCYSYYSYYSDYSYYYCCYYYYHYYYYCHHSFYSYYYYHHHYYTNAYILSLRLVPIRMLIQVLARKLIQITRPILIPVLLSTAINK